MTGSLFLITSLSYFYDQRTEILWLLKSLHLFACSSANLSTVPPVAVSGFFIIWKDCFQNSLNPKLQVSSKRRHYRTQWPAINKSYIVVYQNSHYFTSEKSDCWNQCFGRRPFNYYNWKFYHFSIGIGKIIQPADQKEHDSRFLHSGSKTSSYDPRSKTQDPRQNLNRAVNINHD